MSGRTTFKAGNFEIDVTGPWPVFFQLRDMNNIKPVEIRFSHQDITDLQHIIDRAIREAKLRLGPTRELEV